MMCSPGLGFPTIPRMCDQRGDLHPPKMRRTQREKKTQFRWPAKVLPLAQIPGKAGMQGLKNQRKEHALCHPILSDMWTSPWLIGLFLNRSEVLDRP